jgi:hypothetical protein
VGRALRCCGVGRVSIKCEMGTRGRADWSGCVALVLYVVPGGGAGMSLFACVPMGPPSAAPSYAAQSASDPPAPAAPRNASGRAGAAVRALTCCSMHPPRPVGGGARGLRCRHGVGHLLAYDLCTRLRGVAAEVGQARLPKAYMSAYSRSHDVHRPTVTLRRRRPRPPRMVP